MKFLAIVLSMFLISCDKEQHENDLEFEVIQQEDVKFDLVFPKKLWNYILESAPINMNTKKSPYELFEVLPVDVLLMEKKQGVLNNKNYKFSYADFGGEIDWNAYLNREQNGSFKVEFEFPKIVEEHDMKVLFLSWSNQIISGDEVVGNGCNTFYDLSSHFKNVIRKKGLWLHSNESRYIDLTAGRFYFVNYLKYKIQIAQVTFTDTSAKHLFCKNRL